MKLAGKVTKWRVLNVLVVLILVAVVAPFIVYAMPGLAGGDLSFVVRSGSMEPTIATGDVVIVDRATPDDIEKGDVITFKREDDSAPTTHRAIAITENDGVTYFTTKGDANEDPDSDRVVESELVGEVVLVIPYIGYVVNFANTSLGFFALVAVPFGLLLATEAWSLFRDRSGPSDETDDDTDPPPSSTSTDGAAGSGAAPVAPVESVDGGTSNDDDTDEDYYTLSGTDLRLTLVALLVLAGYSSFEAYVSLTPWSVAMAVAAFGTTLYLAAMHYTATSAARESQPPGDQTRAVPPTRVVSSAIPGADHHAAFGLKVSTGNDGMLFPVTSTNGRRNGEPPSLASEPAVEEVESVEPVATEVEEVEEGVTIPPEAAVEEVEEVEGEMESTEDRDHRSDRRWKTRLQESHERSALGGEIDVQAESDETDDPPPTVETLGESETEEPETEDDETDGGEVEVAETEDGERDQDDEADEEDAGTDDTPEVDRSPSSNSDIPVIGPVFHTVGSAVITGTRGIVGPIIRRLPLSTGGDRNAD